MYALFNQDKSDLRPYANPGLLVVLGFLFVCKKRNETATPGIIYLVKLKHKWQIQPCRLKKGAWRVFRQLVCYEVSSSSLHTASNDTNAVSSPLTPANGSEHTQILSTTSLITWKKEKEGSLQSGSTPVI